MICKEIIKTIQEDVPSGYAMDWDNVGLLFERHLGQKIRRGGGKTSSVKKRTKEDNLRFEKAFETLIRTHL